MKMRTINTILAAGLICGMGSVQAEEDGLGIGVGARYSTLGAGIEIGKSLNDNFGVRLGLNKYSQSDSQTIDDVDYDADLDLSSMALLLDWHPFGGSFHLTGGYLNSSNELTASATPSGDVTIGDNTVNVTAGELVLDGSVKLGSGPYVGLGWGNVPASGFGFVFEAGVVQMGVPDVSLKVTDNTPGQSLSIVQADIDKEIANMEDDLDQFDMYPVVALGISYGF